MTHAEVAVVSLDGTISNLISSDEAGRDALDALVAIVAEESSKSSRVDELINEIVMTRMLSPGSTRAYDFLVGLGLINLTDPTGITAKGRAVVQILVDEAARRLNDGSEVSDAAALFLEKIILHCTGQPVDEWIEAVLDETPRNVSKSAEILLLEYKLAKYTADEGWSPAPLGLLVFEKIGRQTGAED